MHNCYGTWWSGPGLRCCPSYTPDSHSHKPEDCPIWLTIISKAMLTCNSSGFESTNCTGHVSPTLAQLPPHPLTPPSHLILYTDHPAQSSCLLKAYTMGAGSGGDAEGALAGRCAEPASVSGPGGGGWGPQPRGHFPGAQNQDGHL